MSFIELALRAFITAQKLVLNPIIRDDFYGPSALDWSYSPGLDWQESDPTFEQSPFGDGILDYEFEHPSVIPSAEILDTEETSFLNSTAVNQLLDEAKTMMP